MCCQNILDGRCFQKEFLKQIFVKNKVYFPNFANIYILNPFLKGQCHEIFCFRFFSRITLPQAPENNTRVILNFFKSRCTTGVNDIAGKIAAGFNDTGGKFATGINDTSGKFCHQFCLCCWHRWQICHWCHSPWWQIMETISGCRHLKVNLKAKIYIYMLTLLPIGFETNLLKFFWFKIFSICHRCKWHQWCTLSREYLREFSKKFQMAAIVYSGVWWKLIHEKYQKLKILWHCPFKHSLVTTVFDLET